MRPVPRAWQSASQELRARVVERGHKPPESQRPRLRRLALRLVTPSNFDLLAGLVTALVFAPLIVADIPDQI